MNTTLAIQWAQAMLREGATRHADGSLRAEPLNPPKITGLVIDSPEDMHMALSNTSDSITVASAFWERIWSLVSFCDEIAAYYASTVVGAQQPHGLAWRHEWRSRVTLNMKRYPVVRDSKGYTHPCLCSRWRRWGLLLRGR